ncbi:hypothetical protein BDV25DRAFT_136074 [Aspergillus avenaceus]|uniref:Zn(2)-C6 fungal-type domain-containing protein n=1 Tax=Aspergillus avenaceus TaxID=36643 RepID=A0A5N6U6W0_ASPAV|nr:hypothetical protein BDV25DRAFT_136074 [Aspergillus avenaceus]
MSRQSSRAQQACLRCRTQKRKCDKQLPGCALLSRACRYAVQNGSVNPAAQQPSVSVPVPELTQLTPESISSTIKAQVITAIGGERSVRQAAAVYFQTIQSWLPIIDERLYYDRLPSSLKDTPEFCLLTLCMFLLGTVPVDHELSLRMRSLYTLAKTFVALIDATGENTLDLLQARLLLTIFEVGHGMYPAAYMSMGANVRAAVALGANGTCDRQLCAMFNSAERADEARCTWRGIVIADRYVALESGKGSLIHKDVMPMNAAESQGSIRTICPTTRAETAIHEARPSIPSIDQVLTHVHDPTQHQDFNNNEALQLLKTLNAFEATLQAHPALNTLCDSTTALWRSAALTFMKFGCHVKQPDGEYCNALALTRLVELVKDLVSSCVMLVSGVSPFHPGALPVFVIQPVYKAALLLRGDLMNNPRFQNKNAGRDLENSLQCMGGRWLAARRYLLDLGGRDMQ